MPVFGSRPHSLQPQKYYPYKYMSQSLKGVIQKKKEENDKKSKLKTASVYAQMQIFSAPNPDKTHMSNPSHPKQRYPQRS